MSIDAMKQALEALSLELPLGSHLELKSALRAAIEQAQPERQPVQESAITHNHLWIGELYGREKNT